MKDYEKVNATLKAVQDENYQLRDYIISLQSRLLESQGEFPQPPFNIEIHHHPRNGGPPAPQQPAPTAQMAVPAAINQLQAAAAQAVAADISGGKHAHDESFLPGSPDEKRARLNTNTTDLRSIATQLGASNSDSLNNRPVVT